MKRIYTISSRGKYGYNNYRFDTKEQLNKFLTYFGKSILRDYDGRNKRKEFENCPVFGILGPMYNGKEGDVVVIRYEDEKGVFDRVNAESLYEACLESAREDLNIAKEEGVMFIGKTNFGGLHIEYNNPEEEPEEWKINNKSMNYAEALEFISYAYILEFS